MHKEFVTGSRRAFLLSATQSIGLVLSAPAISSLIAGCETNETSPTGNGDNSVTYDVSANPRLSSVGGITLEFIPGLNNDLPVFISRVDADVFVVFSAICTHQGCTVSLPAGPGEPCICPCHSAMYSASSGNVVQQPISGSATNLPQFACSYDAGSGLLTITI